MHLKKSIIVGYDPGTTAAVAIINTNKKILFLTSKKGLKKNEIIKEISKIGTPLIIATDKIPVPKSVEKISQSLGTKLFFPSKSLSTIEKWSLIKDCKIKIKNDHERDALASAIKAYEKYSKLFKKIDRVLSSLYLSELYDKVLKMLIKEEAENITDAVEKIMKKMKKPEKSKKKKIKETPNKKVQELKEIIKQKNDDIELFFYRTHAGAELDLLLVKGLIPKASVEIKFAETPKISKGFISSTETLKTPENYIIIPVQNEEIYRRVQNDGFDAADASLIANLNTESAIGITEDRPLLKYAVLNHYDILFLLFFSEPSDLSLTLPTDSSCFQVE